MLRQIATRLEKIDEAISGIASANYKLSRDHNANLTITFDDGFETSLPYIPFRPHQIALQIKLFIDGIKRHLLSRPRRSGKEVESWNLILEGAVESPGLYLMVYPTNVRARAVLWDGAILLPNGVSVKFLEMIPKRLLVSINNQDMKIKLVNGSVIWVMGSDIDPDKLRGTNARGIVFSEFAFQDPRVFYIMMPVLRQNGGWVIAQSTFDGMNHFYRMIENNKKDPLWHCSVDSIVNLVDEHGNRYITDEMIEEDRRAGMPEYLIQQEYYGNVQINQETKYFAIAINQVYESERLIEKLFLPSKNVYAFYDIGVNDCAAITLAQFERRAGKMWPIVIGYMEDNNKDLRFYVDAIRQFCARYNLPFHSHYIPHDGKNRSFNDGLKNTLDYLQEMGELGFFVHRPSSHRVAIEAIRQKLYMTSFNRENTGRLIDCLSSYEKEFDEKMSRYKDTPVHDWSSHGVKSYQTLVLALDADLIIETCYDVIYINP